MGKFFAPLATGTTPMTLPERHEGNGLMRFFRPHQAGVNVYITGGAATTTQPANVDEITRVFHGGHVPEAVTDSEASILEAGGFSVVDTATLLSSATVFLSPLGVSASWAGEDWENAGDGGATFDTPFLGTNDDVTFTGTGFRIPVQSGTTGGVADDDGFAVPDDGTLAGHMAGDWTFTMTFTPLYDNPLTCRYARKYTGANILVSGAGMVVESTLPVGGFIAAVVTDVVDGFVTGGASFIGSVRSGRQAVTLRMADGQFTVFRGGGKILSRPVEGSPVDASDITIGPGQEIHGLAWWGSALTDAEVLALHSNGGEALG